MGTSKRALNHFKNHEYHTSGMICNYQLSNKSCLIYNLEFRRRNLLKKKKKKKKAKKREKRKKKRRRSRGKRRLRKRRSRRSRRSRGGSRRSDGMASYQPNDSGKQFDLDKRQTLVGLCEILF